MVDNQSPFIIWTFRRSGGTNLGDALFNGSSFNAVQHEPFNVDRIFKHVINGWKENQDIDKLYDDMETILKEKPLIKHCLEIMPRELNQALIEVSIKYGYKHLFLYREKAKSRLLSLNYSMKTNVWGKEHLVTRPFEQAVFEEEIPITKLINHEKSARSEMRRCYDILSQENQRPLAVSFEQLYKSDYSYSSLLVKQIFDELLGSAEIASEAFLEKTLKGGSQGTNSDYTRFPNSSDFLDKLNTLADFKLYTPTTIKYSIADEVVAEHCAIWSCLSGLTFDQVFVHGTFLSEQDFNVVSSGDNGHLIKGLNSKRVHELFPNMPKSKSCRFIYGPINRNDSITIVSLV